MFRRYRTWLELKLPPWNANARFPQNRPQGTIPRSRFLNKPEELQKLKALAFSRTFHLAFRWSFPPPKPNYLCTQVISYCNLTLESSPLFDRNSCMFHPLSSNTPMLSAIRCLDLHVLQRTITTPLSYDDLDIFLALLVSQTWNT